MLWWPVRIGAVVATLIGGYLMVFGSSTGVVVASGVLTALAMLLLRHRAQFLYGAIEVLFGFVCLCLAAGKGRGAFNSDFSDDFQHFQFWVALAVMFGAVYVLIRGLDNCRADLPDRLKCGAEWLGKMLP